MGQHIKHIRFFLSTCFCAASAAAAEAAAAARFLIVCWCAYAPATSVVQRVARFPIIHSPPGIVHCSVSWFMALARSFSGLHDFGLFVGGVHLLPR